LFKNDDDFDDALQRSRGVVRAVQQFVVLVEEQESSTL
jgi:hypothetical protein